MSYSISCSNFLSWDGNFPSNLNFGAFCEAERGCACIQAYHMICLNTCTSPHNLFLPICTLLHKFEWLSGQRVYLICGRSPVCIRLETYLFYSFILIFFTILQTYKCFLNKVNASPNSSPFVEFAGNMNLFVQDRKFEQEMEDDIFQSKIQFLFENKLPLPKMIP